MLSHVLYLRATVYLVGKSDKSSHHVKYSDEEYNRRVDELMRKQEEIKDRYKKLEKKVKKLKRLTLNSLVGAFLSTISHNVQ